MKLFVLGATGATGREFVEQAVGQGHRLTAYGRRAGNLPLDRPNLTFVKGQVTDPAELAGAMAGHEAVVSMLGPSRELRSLRNTSLIETSTRALVSAAEDTGLARVVVLSAFGVGGSLPKASPLARLVYRTFLADPFRDKAEGEKTLVAGEPAWTLVYPVTLNNKPATGTYSATRLQDTRDIPGLPSVPRADVADFLLRTVVTDTHRREVVVLNRG